MEAQRHKDIDDGVELDFAAQSNKLAFPEPPQQYHQQHPHQPTVEDDAYGAPPPKY